MLLHFQRFRRSCPVLMALAAMALSPVSACREAVAQPAVAKDKKEIPPPKDIVRRTKDGLDLVGTFYGSIEGKDAVPVILLHGYKGDRRDFGELPGLLQKAGCAVLAIDLRGHGESTKLVRPNGTTTNLDATRLRKEDFALMVSQDLEEAKRFLMEKNNAGELNIEKLCIVGAEMGATIGLNYAALDWSWPTLSTGKQGQDVKALVLLSPQYTFRGIPIGQALNLPAIQQTLSCMLVVGSGDNSSMRDANRIHKILEKHRPAPPTDPAEVQEKQDLFLVTPETSLSGTKMLGESSLEVNPRIAKFIELRLQNKKFPWTDRSGKLGGS